MHKAKKRFGQNFLQDSGVIRAIIRAINPLLQDNLIEIGPGTGALTGELLPQVAQLTALEIDETLLAELEKKYTKHPGFIPLHCDALHYDWSGLALSRQGTKPIRIVGNLPYNIATPLICRIVEADIPVYDCHFMIQKEVAQRITAKKATTHYGYLTLLIQYFAQADYLFSVPPEAFMPQPKVDSAVIRIKPKPKVQRLSIDYKVYQFWLKIFFAHKRKTLANNIKPYVDSDRFADLALDMQHMLRQRAEQLDMDQLVCLMRALDSFVHSR